MRSREDRRRIADLCTIVHAHAHKSMRACTKAYYGSPLSEYQQSELHWISIVIVRFAGP